MRLRVMTEGQRRKRVLVAGLALSLCGLVAGCGADDSSTAANPSASSGTTSDGDSACVTQAGETLDQWREPPTTLPAELTPLAAVPKPGGEIVKLSKGTIPSEQVTAKAQQEAADLIGWDFTNINFDAASVEDLNAKFMQALDRDPDVVTLASTDPTVVQQPIKRAKEAGETVAISGATGQSDPQSWPGYSSRNLGPTTFPTIAEMLANWMLDDSACTANFVVVKLAGFETMELVADRTQQLVEDACDACQGTEVTIQATDLGTPTLVSAITSGFQANPDAKYLVLPLGDMSNGVRAALDQAGFEDVKIIGSVPNQANIQELQSGDADMFVGLSVVMSAWLQIDAALRAIDTQNIVDIKEFPLSILTADTLPDGATDVPTFPEDYREQFAQLWGVG